MCIFKQMRVQEPKEYWLLSVGNKPCRVTEKALAGYTVLATNLHEAYHRAANELWKRTGWKDAQELVHHLFNQFEVRECS